MAPVPEECLVMVPQQNQPEEVTMPELPVTDTAAVVTTTTVVEIQQQQQQQQQQQPQRRHNAVAQDSLPAEMMTKLERQNSCDSVGSLDEEGIQVDAAPDGQDGSDSHDSSELEPRSERSSSVVSDGSEEGGRDSGIEAEREPDMIIPDDDLMTRIVAQVEFYFSDANVAKDKFLLKHIRRNKEGYVSLKLVSSFKKVKQLTKDWRVVAFSLNKISTKIQINDVGTKIRRVEPLPDLEEVPVTCAVLALSLPLEKPSIQSVSQLFSSCGEIALIRVVRAGTTIPQDLKSLAAKHPSLNDTHCAWIEFESPEAAKAATELTNEDGMKVIPILPEAQKKQEKPTQQQKSQPNSRKNSMVNNNNNNNLQRGQGSRKNSNANIKTGRKDSISGSDGENVIQQRPPRRKCISLPQTQCPNLREISAVVEARKNRPKSKSCTEFPTGSPPTSWVQRHLLAAAAASAASAASPTGATRPPLARPNRISHGSLPLPDGVLRFPKGPDGSKGFSAEARRGILSSVKEITTATSS
ncbi:la-related protein 6-like [Macrobrachium nipponense]|uniref:la-related protein 6-like n=1 Tax=Macrobrachium nipponense TaxID=159736 RepID=UPI0030C85B6A